MNKLVWHIWDYINLISNWIWGINLIFKICFLVSKSIFSCEKYAILLICRFFFHCMLETGNGIKRLLGPSFTQQLFSEGPYVSSPFLALRVKQRRMGKYFLMEITFLYLCEYARHKCIYSTWNYLYKFVFTFIIIFIHYHITSTSNFMPYWHKYS